MGRARQESYLPHEDWVERFKDRVTPRLHDLFTSNHDFTVLPESIAEPLRRLALAEQRRG